MNWIDINFLQPEPGTKCDIWVSEHDGHPAHRRIDHLFVESVGVNMEPAFQPESINEMGLYEGAFYLKENIVTHWLPYSPPPQKHIPQ